jgi:hypothetical protein
MSASHNERLNKFGASRNTTLASQGSAPSPFFYTHPVLQILRHNFQLSALKGPNAYDSFKSFTGALEEELTNQDMLDAEEAL